MNGIIFFEDGTVRHFGQLGSVRKIIQAAQELLPRLLQQEREQFMESLNEEELRTVIDRYAVIKANDDNSNL
jgi:hypothetical protein